MSYWSGSYGGWAPRKTVGQRRAEAARLVAKAAKGGTPMSPVTVTGRTIAHTFWGEAWCDNLERYRDFAYRLERGRSYLRSGSVIDLAINAGTITATVSGSELYEVEIEIEAVTRETWRAIRRDCANAIGSRLDLLAGRLSEPVMARLCADGVGLFPAPGAITFSCTCPDYAVMCKHVAATMYGVGARLDHGPELLFTLRRVSADELHAAAMSELPPAPSAARVLATGGLASLFGIELAPTPATKEPPRTRVKAAASAATPRSRTRAKAAVPEPRPRRRTSKKLAAVKREATSRRSAAAKVATPSRTRTKRKTARR